MKPKRPKNSKTRRNAIKHGYRSGLEYSIATDLTRRGCKFAYESEVLVYAHKLPGGKCRDCGSKRVDKFRKYTPDFTLSNGRRVESKGYFTSRDRSKLISVKEQKGLPAISILFAADNWCTKRHKARYSDWARANGFEFHVGKTIPVAWTL